LVALAEHAGNPVSTQEQQNQMALRLHFAGLRVGFFPLVDRGQEEAPFEFKIF
jgi:hypothetical protein